MSASVPPASPAAVHPRAALVLVVFLVALAARLCVLIGSETYRFDPADDYLEAGWETGRIATHLAEGRGFRLELGTPEPTPTAWLAPIYPYTVALAYRVLGVHTIPSFVAVMLFQILCSALTAALLYVLGAQLGSPRAGLLAGILFAVSPPIILESTDAIVSISLFILLIVVIVIRLVALDRRPSIGAAVSTGAIMGLTLLTEPGPTVFFIAAAVWLASRGGREGRRGALIMGATVALVVAPWVARNYRLFGEFVFIKSNFGQVLFVGNNPEATGFFAPPGETARRTLDPATLERWHAAVGSGDEPASARILGHAARSWIVEHPGRAARLTARKTALFWTHPYLDPNWPVSERVERLAERVARALQLVVLPLALVGAVLALRAGGGLVLPVLFLAIYPLTFILTHVGQDRYRLPSLAFVYLLAGFALVRGAERDQRRT